MYAILTAVFFFLALTNAAGPQKRFGSLAPLWDCTLPLRRKLSGGGAAGAAATAQQGAAEVGSTPADPTKMEA